MSGEDSDQNEEEGEEEQNEGYDDDSQFIDEEEIQTKKKVRQMLAQIEVPQEGINEPIVFSYHYKYEKYLKDNNLIDPEKAKMLAAKLKRKQQLNNDKKEKQKEGKDGAPAVGAILEGEDLSGMDNDDSYPGQMNGKYRFDQLIKTMIARLEYNNTLAPVQEYGRHQVKALKKRKNTAKEKQVEQGGEPQPAKKGGKKDFDDRFYDLDDNFIDDGDMEEDYGGNGLNGGGFDHIMNDDFYTEEADISNTNNGTSSRNIEWDPKADEIKQQLNEQKKYTQIVQRFRVISPDEVHKMIEQGNRPMVSAKQPELGAAQFHTPSKNQADQPMQDGP